MRRFSQGVIFIFALTVTPWLRVQADFAAGSQTLSLFGGSATEQSRTQFSGDTEDHHRSRAGGHLWGAQYVYFFKSQPAFGIGLDGSVGQSRGLRSDHAIAGDRVRGHLHSDVIMPIVKLAYPKGHWRPYLFAGVGAARNSEHLSAEPINGQTWSDTGTTERRTLVDDRALVVAVSEGVGLDYFFTEHFFAGLEARTTEFGRRRLPSSAQGQALGVTASTATSDRNALLRLGWKWGAS